MTDALARRDADGLHTETCPRCKGYGNEPRPYIGLDAILVGEEACPCRRCNGAGVVRWKICGICEGLDPVGCPGCDGAVRIDL
jgi:DnaJ-class molecular chaperone